ncbi:MAG TPA: phosphoribosylaminoimidazolesuccinocarboxamide synthase [Candidatus Limnocylindrales bacterium]|nr:phosphoribosylaminoimidazolesuccinocarboxamide synthase [Candidatus Limnocylindrales bacterium]
MPPASPLADSFLRSGKVRDLYELPDHRMVLVASDRISAFDVVLPSEIPDKGRVLTGISRFWFAETTSIVRNHLLATDTTQIGDAFAARGISSEAIGPLDRLRGRVMICRPAIVLPIEAVVRGYLAGSGWKEYQQTGTVCGIPLPAGLRESDRLPEPIFTPATKAPIGEHDENISFDGMIDHLAGDAWVLGGAREHAPALAERVREISLALYRFGAAVAERKGVTLADTKFEFGLGGSGDPDDLEPVGPPQEQTGELRGEGWLALSATGRLESNLMLIDEVLTPDSSRFWDAADYEPGRSQASFDKQYVRDWLETQPWDKTAPGPELPADVVTGTRARYVEAFERITGASFQRYLDADVIGVDGSDGQKA